MLPVIFNLDSDPSLFTQLAESLDAETGELEQRRFPDGESYVRVHSDCSDKNIYILCNLFQPNDKILKLIFLTHTVRELGARHVCLITPYLPYMRQDKAFNAGECVTSVPFAQLLSNTVDSLVTMDPHLHRYHSLDEIYSIPSTVVAAAPLIANWIRSNVDQPVLIGPDIESEQWVSKVAELADAPFQVLEKIRHSDRDVEVSVPELSKVKDSIPVLVDDIISSGHTMLETIEHLTKAGMKRPCCIGVHGIMADNAYAALTDVADVITTQCIPHPSNQIEIARALAQAASKLVTTNA